MSTIRLAGFLGANRALHPMLLLGSVGVESYNQKPGRGDLRPWKAPLDVAVVPAGRKTIYRMGRDVPSDTNYWLSWTTDVHCVVGGNADETAERTYYTGDGTPKWTNTTLALASTPYPTAARELGVPAPIGACILVASGGVSTLTEDRFYTYTYVTDIGEESANAPVSLRLTCKVDDTVAISGLAAPPAGNYGITLMRIYRTQGSDGSFFFLREIGSTSIGTTDDNRDLGRLLETTTWLTPPADLSFLTGLWNNMLAGISGRSLRFCESGVYYAWPIQYEILPTNAQPVALATFGQNLVMLTDGNPSVVTGSSPDAMDEQPVEFLQACVAPKSAVSMGHGVAWASPDGLAYLGSSGPRMLTESIMTQDDWRAINPGSIIGRMYERRYVGFYTVAAERKAFIIDPANPDGMYFLDFGVDAVFIDDLQDTMYVLDGINIQKWDAGAAKTVTFKSKVFHQPKPVPGFACAEVVAGSYPVSFKLYADGVLKHTQSVTSAGPFRLPGGYHAQDFQVEVSTTDSIQFVAMAHSMQELAAT